MDMTSVLLKLSEQLNNSVFVLLGILGCAFWAVYKIGEFKEKFNQRHNETVKAQNVDKKMGELKAKVDLIYDNTKRKH